MSISTHRIRVREPMGITWYRADQGYVPNYTDGMRLIMFADAKTNTYGWNTSGWHVFGNADMRDCWASNYWYNYSGIWPSSGGVSVKTVSDIIIYSNQAPPVAPSSAFTRIHNPGQYPLPSSLLISQRARDLLPIRGTSTTMEQLIQQSGILHSPTPQQELTP